MAKYLPLERQVFSHQQFSIVPIRSVDRFAIMNWRNEQIYHLRQSKLLTEADQEHYFENTVSQIFEQETPAQILFSYLENDTCIGYGGLVHINWLDMNAEVSFIMDTSLEAMYFEFHWSTYLNLIKQVAFKELKFHKLYTYAFDLRPNLYEVLEKNGFTKEARLKEHFQFNGEYRDVVIHSIWYSDKVDKLFTYRQIKQEDEGIILEWSNDPVSRSNSFMPNPIAVSEHKAWFKTKLHNPKTFYLIAEFNQIKVAFVRFDIKENETVIGINVAPHFRRKGFASTIVRECSNIFKTMFNKRIFAYVKNENLASKKVFEKAGFMFFEETIVEGCPVLIYEY